MFGFCFFVSWVSWHVLSQWLFVSCVTTCHLLVQFFVCIVRNNMTWTGSVFLCIMRNNMSCTVSVFVCIVPNIISFTGSVFFISCVTTRHLLGQCLFVSSVKAWHVLGRCLFVSSVKAWHVLGQCQQAGGSVWLYPNQHGTVQSRRCLLGIVILGSSQKCLVCAM